MKNKEITFCDIIKFNLSVATEVAGCAGMSSHALLLLLIGAPTALLDRCVASCATKPSPKTRQKRAPKNEYELIAPNLIHKYITHQSTYNSSLHVYKGGFFVKYPLGIIAEASGLIVNAAVSAATFVTVATAGFALLTGLGAIALGLGILYLFFSKALPCLAGCSRTTRESNNYHRV